MHDPALLVDPSREAGGPRTGIGHDAKRAESIGLYSAPHASGAIEGRAVIDDEGGFGGDVE